MEKIFDVVNENLILNESYRMYDWKLPREKNRLYWVEFQYTTASELREAP